MQAGGEASSGPLCLPEVVLLSIFKYFHLCLTQQTGSSLGNTGTLKCISSVLPPGSPQHCGGKKIEEDKLTLYWGPGGIP